MQPACFHIDEIREADFEYIAHSYLVIFGSPTYMASVTAKMKTWLEANWQKMKLDYKKESPCKVLGLQGDILRQRVNLSCSAARNAWEALEKTAFFFQAIEGSAKMAGSRGRVQRLVPVVLMSSSKEMT